MTVRREPRKKKSETVSADKKVAALLDLWKGSGARITERRSYEWKIAFGVWGAQLAAMGVLLAHSSNIHSRLLLFSVYLAGGVVVAALHAMYVGRFVSIRNKEDSKQAKYYERRRRNSSSTTTRCSRPTRRRASGRRFSRLASRQCWRPSGRWRSSQ